MFTLKFSVKSYIIFLKLIFYSWLRHSQDCLSKGASLLNMEWWKRNSSIYKQLIYCSWTFRIISTAISVTFPWKFNKMWHFLKSTSYTCKSSIAEKHTAILIIWQCIDTKLCNISTQNVFVRQLYEIKYDISLSTINIILQINFIHLQSINICGHPAIMLSLSDILTWLCPFSTYTYFVNGASRCMVHTHTRTHGRTHKEIFF